MSSSGTTTHKNLCKQISANMGAMKRPSTKNNNNNKKNASRERKTRIRIEQGEKTAKKIENYDGKKIVRCMTTTQLYVCVCCCFFCLGYYSDWNLFKNLPLSCLSDPRHMVVFMFVVLLAEDKQRLVLNWNHHHLFAQLLFVNLRPRFLSVVALDFKIKFHIFFIEMFALVGIFFLFHTFSTKQLLDSLCIHDAFIDDYVDKFCARFALHNGFQHAK